MRTVHQFTGEQGNICDMDDETRMLQMERRASRKNRA
jgi:hypothetical protein